MSTPAVQNPDPTFGNAQAIALIRRAFAYIAPFRKEFAVKVGLLLASLLPMLVLPWPAKLIIDHVVGNVALGSEVRPYPFFFQPVVLMLEGQSKLTILIVAIAIELLLLVVIGAASSSPGERSRFDENQLADGQDTATRTENEANAGFSLIGGLLGLVDYQYTMKLTQRLNHHYRSKLYERMQALPMTTFDDERIGDAVYRVMYDTPAITNICYRLLLTPIGSPINILLTVVVLSSVYGAASPVVLLAIGFLPMVLIATWPFASMVRKAGARSRAAGSVTTTSIEESMSSITAVQSLGTSARESKRFDKDSTESFRAFRVLALTGMMATMAGAVFGSLLIAGVFVEIADEVIDGTMSAGDVGVLLPYFASIAVSSVNMGALWIRVQESTTGLSRVFWLMDLPSETDPPGAVELPAVRESVRVENVSFAYDPDKPVLKDVSFEAKRGQLTAFVGPAGTGKTTLAYMIPRFLSPTQGRVLIDGHDIAGVTRSSLRAQIAFVFQETTLFDMTIAENLRLGNPGASDEQVWAAARTAGIADFLEGLPEKMETRLGRNGGKLSVGQKQRLSIARALVCPASIMIFDEPTSALDPETEGRIVAALEAAAKDRVVIVIAHRLSTVRNAEQILFLQEGQVVERGSHRALMGRDGPYRQFVELQTLGH
jgi:ABC-type multidrug transport system fused ATPase/permease subunit